MQEGFERFFRALAGMILKHRKQSDYSDTLLAKRRRDALRLRQPVRDASPTQHLERLNQHHTPAQRLKDDRRPGIEPELGPKFRRPAQFHRLSFAKRSVRTQSGQSNASAPERPQFHVSTLGREGVENSNCGLTRWPRAISGRQCSPRN